MKRQVFLLFAVMVLSGFTPWSSEVAFAGVIGGVYPTVDLTERLNGASNGDMQLNTAYVVGGVLYTNDIDIADIAPSGGVLQPFVRISAITGMTQGYNTSGRPVQYDENTSYTFTHDLLLAAIPLSYFDVDGDGVKEGYRQFRLDINENDTDLLRWLSVDAIQIWQSDTFGLNSGFVPATDDADQASYLTIGFTTGAEGNYLAYNMDGGDAGNWAAMNYMLNAGSGVADLVLLVPEEFFDPDLDYVYLYSQFGNQPGTSDIYWDSNGDFIPDETLLARTWEQEGGFEEWAITAEIPSEKSGVKFEDLDGDGQAREAGEPGLGGWTIFVDYDDDGVLDAGEAYAVTAGDGSYTITGIVRSCLAVSTRIMTSATSATAPRVATNMRTWMAMAISPRIQLTRFLAGRFTLRVPMAWAMQSIW
jgi:hypothetical protein